MEKEKILIVEDEEGIRGLIQLYLENRGFTVYAVGDGEKAIQIANTKKPDLVLLDIEMPHMDGFEVCERIRENLNVPIIFISSRREVTDKVRSFDIGGDDYITKPFDFDELEARIQANIRRYIKGSQTKAKKNKLQYKQLEVHLDSFECYVNGKLLPLSTREMEILILLAKHPNQVWSAEQIYNQIWGYDSLGDIQTVKVHISNLRRKLDQRLIENGTSFIETVRGFGYKFIS